ncbi:MAG: outer membrane beta-barrel protein [Nibricoccus sp.]
MKTYLKQAFLVLAVAATAGSAFAQRSFVRAELSSIAASDGPYDDAGGGITLSAGSFLDADKHHEVSFSVGFLGWEESRLRDYTRYGSGVTTLRIEDSYYDIPDSNALFKFADEKMTLSDGTTYTSDYRPSLLAVPLMANYRLYLGDKDARIRFFAGAGAGYASLHAESELWRRFTHHHHGEQTDSAWAFTWNATAGVSIKVIERLRLDASFVYQEIGGATFNMTSIVYKLDRMNTGALRFGASWAF